MRLRDRGVTAGNISYNMLALNGLVDIAEDVYLERREKSEEKKLREAELLVRYMDSFISQKGYATKPELFAVMKNEHGISQSEVKRLFTYFKKVIWETRTYKTPSQKDIEKYGLNGRGWIITNKV